MEPFFWIVVIGTSAALLSWVAWRLRRQWRIRTLNWPAVEGPSQLETYCITYLSRHGWETYRRHYNDDATLNTLPEDVRILARRGELEIGIAAAPYPSLAMFNTFVTCAGRVVIVTSVSPIADRLREEAAAIGVPLLHYTELPDLERFAALREPADAADA